MENPSLSASDLLFIQSGANPVCALEAQSLTSQHRLLWRHNYRNIFKKIVVLVGHTLKHSMNHGRMERVLWDTCNQIQINLARTKKVRTGTNRISFVAKTIESHRWVLHYDTTPLDYDTEYRSSSSRLRDGADTPDQYLRNWY